MKTPYIQYGGKSSMISHLLSLAPDVRDIHCYCEPFFGGGSLFFSLDFAENTKLWINDSDHRLINFWLCLQSKSRRKKLLGKIAATLHSEYHFHLASDIWRKAKKEEPDECGFLPHPERKAWATWTATQMGFAKTPGGGFAYVKSDSSRHAPINCLRAAGSLLEASKKLRSAYIFNRDAIEIIGKIERESRAFIYADPPYPGTDQGHFEGYTFKDFSRILDALERVRGKFMLSCYGNAEIEGKAKTCGWSVFEIERPCSAKNSNGGKRERRAELIVINYTPPLSQRRLF